MMKIVCFAAAAGPVGLEGELGIVRGRSWGGPGNVFICNKKNMGNAVHVCLSSLFLWCLLQLVCVYRGIFINTVITKSKYTAE